MQNKAVTCGTFKEGFCMANNISIHYTRTDNDKPPIYAIISENVKKNTM